MGTNSNHSLNSMADDTDKTVSTKGASSLEAASMGEESEGISTRSAYTPQRPRERSLFNRPEWMDECDPGLAGPAQTMEHTRSVSDGTTRSINGSPPRTLSPAPKGKSKYLATHRSNVDILEASPKTLPPSGSENSPISIASSGNHENSEGTKMSPLSRHILGLSPEQNRPRQDITAVDPPLPRGPPESGSRPMSSPSSDNRAIKRVRTDETRGRLASTGIVQKPKDWSIATEKPAGLTKLASDMCLTCIQYGRGCTGTLMAEVLTAKGVKDIRCLSCTNNGGRGGHGGRKCYWKEPAKGIFTYEDARVAYNGITNFKNTRAGRLARAQNPTSRLSLQPEVPYAPPAPEERKSSGYQSLRTAPLQVVQAPGCRPIRPAGPNFTVINPGTQFGQFTASASDTPRLQDRMEITANSEDKDSDEITDNDIRSSFEDVKRQVKQILGRHCNDQPKKRDLYSAMLGFVENMTADPRIVDGVRARVLVVRDEAVAEDE